jgi:polysaccharide chain length determinant protein (PEP-CTERM system associated)
VAGVVSTLPSIYRSTATIVVDRQQVPEVFVRPTVTSGLDTLLQTITQEILSRSRLEDLITRFGLYPDLLKRNASPELVIQRMREDIQLEVRGSDPRVRGNAMVAFTISYRGNDPRVVAEVTNTLASFYIQENLKARERQATSTAEFLRTQVEATQARLDEQERLVSEFKTRHMGELPQQLDANLATLERLHSQLRMNHDNQNKVQERSDALARHAVDGDVPIMGPAADAAPARLIRLRQELAELRSQYSEKYPDVARVRTELQALEQQLAGQVSDRKPGVETPAVPAVSRQGRALAEAQAELKALKAEEQQLRGAIGAYQKRVEAAPKREQEYQEFSRDYQSTRNLYQTLLGRYEEAQLAESMEQRQKGEQFRLLESALSSDQPAAPRRARLLLMGLLGSVGLAVAVGLALEKLDTSFHGLDELRAAATIPILASIPVIPTSEDARRSRMHLRLEAASLLIATAVLTLLATWLARGNEQLVWLLSRGV